MIRRGKTKKCMAMEASQMTTVKPVTAVSEPHNGDRGHHVHWIELDEGYPKIPWDKRYGVRLRSCHGLKFLLGQNKKF